MSVPCGGALRSPTDRGRMLLATHDSASGCFLATGGSDESQEVELHAM